MNLKFCKSIYIWSKRDNSSVFAIFIIKKKMLSIVESKRKKSTLLLDGFRYTQDKVFNTTIYWKRGNRSCPGCAIQYGSNPPSMKNPHNRDGDEMKCKMGV